MVSKFRQPLLLQVLAQDPCDICIAPPGTIAHQGKAFLWRCRRYYAQRIAQCLTQSPELLAFAFGRRSQVQALQYDTLYVQRPVDRFGRVEQRCLSHCRDCCALLPAQSFRNSMVSPRHSGLTAAHAPKETTPQSITNSSGVLLSTPL